MTYQPIKSRILLQGLFPSEGTEIPKVSDEYLEKSSFGNAANNGDAGGQDVLYFEWFWKGDKN